MPTSRITGVSIGRIALQAGGHDLAEVERRRRIVAVAHRIEVVEHHEGERDEQPGDEAGDQQACRSRRWRSSPR